VSAGEGKTTLGQMSKTPQRSGVSHLDLSLSKAPYGSLDGRNGSRDSGPNQVQLSGLTERVFMGTRPVVVCHIINTYIDT
jgi:hypothetical protein